MFTANKDDVNSYYTPPSDASGGAAISFIPAFDRAYEANARASSAFAIAHAVGVEQDRINEALTNAGEEPIPKTWYSATDKGDEGLDLNTATSIDETGREFSNASRSVVEYNKRIMSLREKHPDLDLPLVGEQFDRVKKKAEDAKLLQEKTHYSGVGGYVGSFAGQVSSDMNPALNPINTASLALGGFGKTALMRIGTEMGVNAGVAFVNDATGVNEQRRLLGLPEETTGQMIAGAAVAGLGAGVIRGVGEGVGILAKRWFPDVPELSPPPEMLRPGEAPPAHLTPEQRDFVVARQYSDMEMNGNLDINAHSVTQDSLFGSSRSAVGRFEEDMPHVERAFNEGADIAPPRVDVEGRTVDGLAREIDPDTFRMYDRIREEKKALEGRRDVLLAKAKEVTPDVENIVNGDTWASDVGGAAWWQGDREGFFLATHVTNDAQGLEESLARGLNPSETYKASKNDELGAGLYVSARPGAWGGRGSDKIDVRFNGDFVVLSRRQPPDVIERLRILGFDGAMLRGTGGSPPQTVIWNRGAIAEAGRFKGDGRRGAGGDIKNTLLNLKGLMGRAYARAENEWVPSAVTKSAVEDMVNRGERILPERVARTTESASRAERSVNVVSDENKALVDRYGGRSVEETATQAITRSTTRALDESDKALDKVLADLPKAIEEGRLPEGLPEGLDLDKEIPLGLIDENGNAGKMTLREFLQDSLDDERAMKAVSVCQINS